MEEQARYELPIDDSLAVSRAYTLYLKHIGMISDLKQRGFGRYDSEIVRNAIEAYFEQCNAKEEPK